MMKGCLLSRKVKVLRALMELKTLAHRFASASGRLAPKQDAELPGALDPATGGCRCWTPTPGASGLTQAAPCLLPQHSFPLETLASCALAASLHHAAARRRAQPRGHCMRMHAHRTHAGFKHPLRQHALHPTLHGNRKAAIGPAAAAGAEC